MHIHLTLTILFFFSPYSHYVHTFTSSSPTHPHKRIGIAIQDYVTISSSSSSKKFKADTKTVELQLSWEFLIPSVAQQIRHNCGKGLFNGMLKSSYNTNNYEKPKFDLLRSVNCTFTQEYAVLTLHHDSTAEFIISSRKLVALKISSFKGEDENEVCSVKLSGYEKFSTIFVAYNNDKKSTILKFPKSFVKFINLNAVQKGGGSSLIIFDPNAGKGKTFQRTKKCIEFLLGNQKPLEMEVIENFCIIECNDAKKPDVRKPKVQKNKNNKNNNSKNNKTRSRSRVEL